MGEIPTTYVAIDGLDPAALSDTETAELGEALATYVRGAHDPDRLDVYVFPAGECAEETGGDA